MLRIRNRVGQVVLSKVVWSKIAQLQLITMAAVHPYMFKPDSDTETHMESTKPPSQPRLEQDLSECKYVLFCLKYNVLTLQYLFLH